MHGPRKPLLGSLLLASALVVALVIALPTLAFGVDADAWEDGDDLSSGATVIAANGSLQNHTVVPGDDADWFRFPVVSGTSYIIETAPVPAGTAVDTVANLYGADGTTWLAYDDEGGTGSYSQIRWTSDYTGDAFVTVEGYWNDETGDYALSVAEFTPGSISGTVTHGTTLLGDHWVDAYLWNASESTWNYVTTAYTAANGTYTLADLVPGNYRVEFPQQFGYFYEAYNNQPTFDEATVIPVAAGVPVTNINADLDHEVVPPTVTSSVIWNNTSRACVALSAEDAGSGLLSFTWQIDGGAIQTISGASTIVTGAAAGSHTLHYVATDYAGNVTQGDVAFTVGTASPAFTGPTFDLIFVIDTTGSMGDDIDAVKASMTDLVTKIVVEHPNFRLALVDFKDYPLGSYGDASDYPFRDMLGFTNDLGALFTGINSLGATGGNDWPESHYAALIHSIDANTIGGWRDGGKKCVVIMTDAPPHGSDPSNVYDAAYPTIPKYTLTDVINHAMAVDPAQVFPVVVGGDSDAIAGMSAIAAGTGGVLVKADDAGGIPDALMSALSAMNSQPTAEANGPYSGFVGIPIQFSSAGSADSTGTIANYVWDFNGDGTFDETTTATSIAHTYAAAFEGTVTVKAIDNNGFVGLDQARARVVVAGATTLTITSSDATPKYGRAVTLSAPLLSGGIPVAGKTVVFERRSGTKWIAVGTASTAANGAASVSVKPYKLAKTTYRARFAGSSPFPASTSASVVVKPHVYLTKGNAPRTMYKGRARTITGYLKPRHASGSTAVRIYRYKRVSGRWKSYGYVRTRLANYRSYSKYTKSLKFSSKGKWRIRAVMGADSKHAKTYSTYDYVTVR